MNAEPNAKSPDLVVCGEALITMNERREVIPDGAVAIRGERITQVGPRRDVLAQLPQGAAARVLDAPGSIICPGFVNTHTHLYQYLFKGLGDDLDLKGWSVHVTNPLALALTEENCYYAALAGSLEALRSGTTTIADFFHVHPRPNLGDQVARALNESGIRAVLGRGYRARGSDGAASQALAEDLDTALSDAERLRAQYRGPRLDVWLAPSSIRVGNGREALLLTKEAVDKIGFGVMMHVAETDSDNQAALAGSGLRSVELLQDVGLLGSKFLAVHSIWLTASDIERLANTSTPVSHNPVANMYVADGVAPIPDLLASGVTVGLGTDGPASNNSMDMFETLKMAALIHKVTRLDPTAMSAEKVLEMATIGGSRALGMENEIGSIEPGKRADLFVFDPLRPKSTPVNRAVSTLVYSAGTESIRHVVVDGRVLLEDGRFPHLDEAKILAQAQHECDTLVERAGLSARRLVWQH